MLPKYILSGVLLLGLLLAPAWGQAQNVSIQKRESGRTTTTSVKPLRAGVVIRNGMPMQVKGNNFSPLTQPMTFKNGAVLHPSGQFTTPGGQVQQLSEGDHLDLNGNLTRSVVVIEKNTTVTGDTTGIGKQLMQAFHLREREKLLQEKVRILEEKNKLLERNIQNKPDAATLQKMDAELAQLQQKIEAANRQE